MFCSFGVTRGIYQFLPATSRTVFNRMTKHSRTVVEAPAYRMAAFVRTISGVALHFPPQSKTSRHGHLANACGKVINFADRLETNVEDVYAAQAKDEFQ